LLTMSLKTHLPVVLQLIQAIHPEIGLIPKYKISVSISCLFKVSATSFSAVYVQPN